MTETKGEYLIDGKQRLDNDPNFGRIIEMLVIAKGVMQRRIDRHEKRSLKAKHERDRQFHSNIVTESRAWIRDCDTMLDGARRDGIHVPTI